MNTCIKQISRTISHDSQHLLQKGKYPCAIYSRTLISLPMNNLLYQTLLIHS